MIFISHTHKDKPIVEPIANRLAAVYGRDKVFYDSWSIQPGDGIIDKMNEGLSECRFFFFFVSKNSLQSNMVKIEWQNAIIKATNAQAKLIPVKLDDCMMPAIMLQTLYIDVFGRGLEDAIRQMIDVINGNNTYVPKMQTYENIRGYIRKINEQEVDVEFRAETYTEPISRYLLLVKNPEKDINANSVSDSMYNYGFNESITLNNGLQCNAISFVLHRPTTPGFPAKFKLKSKTKVELIGLMRATSEDLYTMIPYVFV